IANRNWGGRTMTVALTRPRGIAGKWRGLLLWLAGLLALAAVVLLAIGPLGWRLGWWHFRFAFLSLMPWAAYCGLAAMAIAVLALIFGWRGFAARHVAVALIAFVVGGAIAYVPWHYDQMRGTVPPIHDITTDPDNPPAFVAAAASGKAGDLTPNDDD